VSARSGDFPPYVTAGYCTVRRANVKRYETREVDNRDSREMYGYMEARIEVLKRRVLELEGEIEKIRWKESAEQHSRRKVYAARA
jgi:hypothetical protein